MSVLDRPLIEVRAVFADGSQESRYWTMNDMRDKRPDLDLPEWPDWMREPRKTWAHPQDPITYSFLVVAGREADARAWMEAL